MQEGLKTVAYNEMEPPAQGTLNLALMTSIRTPHSFFMNFPWPDIDLDWTEEQLAERCLIQDQGRLADGFS